MTILAMFRKGVLKLGILLKAMETIPSAATGQFQIIKGRAYRVLYVLVNLKYKTIILKGENGRPVSLAALPPGKRSIPGILSWSALSTF